MNFIQRLQLTTMENVAWRFPDVRQDDIVFAKPISAKQETNVKRHNTHHVLFCTFVCLRYSYSDWRILSLVNQKSYLKSLARPTPSCPRPPAVQRHQESSVEAVHVKSADNDQQCWFPCRS